ncbi:hypothetical protein [Aequorivita echinoideorum]|uniref:ThuA-like domain-containing protein n=1 Tax=Aequorivita echinoideorum TaxID=1549647 RepID=A0ABS5S4W3_9FLAO|nr:hypothetical protein [Aequorivita echinoideorum]MBT0607439.1 hypothetical protein [Aequorivita echinoideorum]
MKKIGLLFNGVWSHYVFATAPKYKDVMKLVYIHDLSDDELEGLEGLMIPFQSNQDIITEKKEVIYSFLKKGKKVFVEGDTTSEWLDAEWVDRPTNNYWWVENPNNPPISDTDFSHPIYEGLSPRHSCWHTHGSYLSAPKGAKIIQTKPDGEIITWETHEYGGTLMATTLDPIVEIGVQQITHLDNYVEKLVKWMCGEEVTGNFEVPKENYGIAV